MKLLFCSGADSWSRLIRLFTRSKYSHVAFLFLNDQIIEAREGHGVWKTDLNWYKNYNGTCEIIELKGIDKETETKIYLWAVSKLGKPYRWVELFQILKRQIFHLGHHNDKEAYICSEFVRDGFFQAGIWLKESSGGFVTPKNIFQDLKDLY